MAYLFTSESVSEGHPDKVADQISDSILDDFYVRIRVSRCCETFVGTGLVIVGRNHIKILCGHQTIARNTIRHISYTKSEYRFDADSCAVISAIHEQSPDIAQGVDKKEQGAGDQGMMFGYACKDTEEYMPLPLTLAHIILLELSKIEGVPSPMPYLRPDARASLL